MVGRHVVALARQASSLHWHCSNHSGRKQGVSTSQWPVRLGSPRWLRIGVLVVERLWKGSSPVLASVMGRTSPESTDLQPLVWHTISSVMLST